MDKKGCDKYKAMKIQMILLLVILFLSCSKNTENQNDSFPYLILESYSLNDGPYIFSCFDENDKFIDVNDESYYSYNKLSFMSYSNNSSRLIKTGKLYDDLLSSLYKYNGYNYSFIENSIDSIMIYSDSIFCGIPKEESLNRFFEMEGLFVRIVNGKYELYNDCNILNNDINISEILFPEQFRLRLVKGIDLERKTYQFYIRLKYENKIENIKIVKINLSKL